jgi:hypothetical protein
MTLRVMAKDHGGSVDKDEVSRLLVCESDRANLRHWCLHAPDKAEADLDSQVAWILSRVTDDLDVWNRLVVEYRIDIFCGLFMERKNRGVSLSPRSMAELSVRGIQIGFDIYAQ